MWDDYGLLGTLIGLRFGQIRFGLKSPYFIRVMDVFLFTFRDRNGTTGSFSSVSNLREKVNYSSTEVPIHTQ